MDSEEPNEISEDIKKLEERKKQLEGWQESLRKAQEAAPYVQENLEQTDWQVRALKNLPQEAVEIPYFGRQEELEQENKFLRDVFPILKSTDFPTVVSSTATTTSGSMNVHEYINRVRDLGTQNAIIYGNTYLAEYDQIQAAQGREKEVRSLIKIFGSTNLMERYNRAFMAYFAYKGKTGDKTAAGNEIRNLLLGLGGELFERARKWTKENMTWKLMSPRLAIGGGRSHQHITLENQGKTRSALLKRLAEVLKDREGGSVTDLNAIWTETLDHIYTVIRLVDID